MQLTLIAPDVWTRCDEHTRRPGTMFGLIQHTDKRLTIDENIIAALIGDIGIITTANSMDAVIFLADSIFGVDEDVI